jgi:REP element-mobilizing transposase RayT
MPRVEYAGAIYHVTVRMVGHAWESGHGLNPAVCLFRDDAERERFVEQLGERVEAYGIRLYAWCLMLTHFHLYLETPRANLGRFMHSLETAYTVYSNLRRERHGPLVGRYKAKPVEGDDYHLALSRYVHLNPVRTKAVQQRTPDERRDLLRAYRWSSYRAYVGKATAPEWLTCGPILAHCGGRTAEQRREYARFVESSLAQGDEETAVSLKASPLAIGGETFVDWIREQLIERGRKSKHPDDTGLRKVTPVVSVDRVLEVTADAMGVTPAALRARRRHSDLRGLAAHMLCRQAGLTQREVAAVLGMRSGSAVAFQHQRLAARLKADRALCRQVAAIENRLASQTPR